MEDAEKSCTISFGNNNSALCNFITEKKEEIDEDLAMSIDMLKLNSGDYYDYRFLTIAVEMTLLEEEARGNVRIRDTLQL